MANWAKLQEDTIQKAVVKRAKHGIHFDNGDGQVQALFSGAPCHYFDGIWKPIDTKLIAIGSEYGAPGLKPRIKTDGTVRIDGTKYSQRSTRIGIFNPATMKFTAIKTIPLGSLSTDKMIAESGVWRRELRLTETGLTEEIIIASKPTNTGATINDWLVLETAVSGVSFKDGWLSDFELGEFKFPPPSAHDAEGNVADCKRFARTISGVQYIYTGVSAEWMNKAVYPVVIDPDFSIGDTNYGDTVLCGGHTTRQTYNYGAIALSEAYAATSDRVLLRFDLTSVASGSTCTVSTLKLYHARKSEDSRLATYTAYSIAAANTDWIEGTQSDALAASGSPCWNARKADGSGGVTDAWAGSAGLSTSGTDYEETALGSVQSAGNADLGTENFIDLTTTRVGGWFGSPNTNYGILIIQSGYAANQGFGLSENTTSGYRPVLSVTYSSGALLKVNMNGQMQNLSGGMRG